MKKYERKKRVKVIAIILVCAILLLTGCSSYTDSYASLNRTVPEDNILSPVDSYYVEDNYTYDDAGVTDKCIATYESVDGLCVIKKMEHYYDVTLDYECGTAKEVGRAYAATICAAFPEYEEIMEPYIYENINEAFPNHEGDYNAVKIRLDALLNSIPEVYRDEIEGYAEVLSDGERGFEQNGQISYEEALLVQMVPDALRGTACSALSLWGEKTVTGDRITFRSLEWWLGSNNQMCTAHAVVHMKKADRTITSLNVLGLLNIVSAANNDGVFAAILDASTSQTYTCEGKECYTFALRYALEEFDNATDLGKYMVDQSENYTYSHNIIISDEEHTYCAEDAVQVSQDSGEAYSILRDENTPLMEGLQWDSEDSLCVVNSFASAGNRDGFSGHAFNIVRFAKYNKWVASLDKFSVADVKNMMTQEIVNQNAVSNVHVSDESSAYQLIIMDYNAGRIQVAFTGVEGVVDRPVFVDIGGWNE